MEVVVVAVVVLLFLAMRARRIFRRRMVQPGLRRTGIFLGAAGTLGSALPALCSRPLLPYAATGLAVGIALGVLSSKLSYLERSPDGIAYQADPYVGSAVLLLFIGLLGYRVFGWFTGSLAELRAATWSPVIVMLRTSILTYFFSCACGIFYRVRRLASPGSAESPGQENAT